MVKYNDGILFVILTSERVFFMQKIKNVFGAYAEPAILVANLYLIIDLKWNHVIHQPWFNLVFSVSPISYLLYDEIKVECKSRAHYS